MTLRDVSEETQPTYILTNALRTWHLYWFVVGCCDTVCNLFKIHGL